MAQRNPLKREYVQLAHDFDAKKHSPAGWFMSEKLDGQRAWWDGGISRGKLAAEVPYANTVKDHIRKEIVTATGLYSRGGNVIHAPAWFLDQLPKFPIDGELWLGRGRFQDVEKCVKDIDPGPVWKDVKYMIFDAPEPTYLFLDGDISIRSEYKVYLRGCVEWWKRFYTSPGPWGICPTYEAVHNFLCDHIKMTANLKVHTQFRMPFNGPVAFEELYRQLNEITDQGGEGLMLRKPSALWEPKRSWNILKVKKFKDAEATVIGYTTGRETDRGSKLLGMMGALITNFNGKRLELSGFTEAERILSGIDSINDLTAREWASSNPEKEVPNWINNAQFPRGSKVTFRYRELTDDGIPKEARYYRKFIQ